MEAKNPTNQGSGTRTQARSTCLGCGLLCDDLVLTIDHHQIVDVNQRCPKGRDWFLSTTQQSSGLPAATIDGLSVPVEDAIQSIIERILPSQAILITGLSELTNEAVSLAVEIAKHSRAVIDPEHRGTAQARIEAIQREGLITASFGELKTRADVVLFWNLDPFQSHPRFWERFIEPVGRFVPQGRSGRKILVVDSGASEIRERADLALTIRDDLQAEVLRVLRAMIRGIPLEASRVATTLGLELEELRLFAEQLRTAHYGAVVSGPLMNETATAVGLSRLVRDLNDYGRTVVVPLTDQGNPTGVESVLTSRLGGPFAMDLGSGHPRYLPGDAEGTELINRRETDLVIILGRSSVDLGDRSDIPIIRIGPNATAPPLDAQSVAINSATPGIDSGGTVIRSDEVPLPVRPVIAPHFPTIDELLAQINRYLKIAVQRAKAEAPFRNQ